VEEMSETEEKNIKALEKRKGRFWVFKKKIPLGTVEPLSQSKMTTRLRNLWVYTMKTMGNFLRETIGEKGLQELYEHQAEEYAENAKMFKLKADDIAIKAIKFNLQPQGIEAVYEGDEKEAVITTKSCPLPQKLLKAPEFLQQISFDEKPLLVDFGADTLTSKGEWPPKRLESCHNCQVVMPKIGEKLGFNWEHGLTEGPYKKCYFKITIKDKNGD
jgi:hypothetical protein